MGIADLAVLADPVAPTRRNDDMIASRPAAFGTTLLTFSILPVVSCSGMTGIGMFP